MSIECQSYDEFECHVQLFKRLASIIHTQIFSFNLDSLLIHQRPHHLFRVVLACLSGFESLTSILPTIEHHSHRFSSKQNTDEVCRMPQMHFQACEFLETFPLGRS